MFFGMYVGIDKKNTMHKYLYLLLASVALGGCQRTVSCSDGTLKLDLTAYAMAERDTIIIDMYEGDVLQSSDTSYMDSYGDYTIVNRGKSHQNTPDALYGMHSKHEGKSIDIFVPATGRNYRLSDFRSYPRNIKVSSRYKADYLCFNNQLGLSVDGVPIVLNGDGSYTLRLDK